MQTKTFQVANQQFRLIKKSVRSGKIIEVEAELLTNRTKFDYDIAVIKDKKLGLFFAFVKIEKCLYRIFNPDITVNREEKNLVKLIFNKYKTQELNFIK